MFNVSEAGDWSLRHVTPAGENPSFLCMHPTGRTLYTVHGDRDAVSAFEVTPEDGGLSLLGTWPAEGRNPVHLAMAPSGRWLVVACYATGTVSSLPVEFNGALGAAASVLRVPGAAGPLEAHQKGSHPHQVVFDPSGRWLLVPDKGVDCVSVLRLDDSSGELSMAAQTSFPPGSGPRHLVFNAKGSHVYVACELSSEVCFCGFEVGTGALETIQTLATVPPGASGHNTAAGIVLTSQNDVLYVSNRGSDSVARFSVDPLTGQLAATDSFASGGRTPRFITLSPDGSNLLVANEDGDSIVQLPPTDSTRACVTVASTGSPVCIVFTKELK